MKQFSKIILVLLVVLSFSASVVSAGELFDNMTYKLGRGLTNIVTSPLDVLKTFDNEFMKYGSYKGTSYGVIKGLSNGVSRLCVGVFEVLTFPFEIPENYGPIIEPEFILDDYRLVGQKY
jgi:putative exosortase-associated protein (TIGR04073 family)